MSDCFAHPIFHLCCKSTIKYLTWNVKGRNVPSSTILRHLEEALYTTKNAMNIQNAYIFPLLHSQKHFREYTLSLSSMNNLKRNYIRAAIKKRKLTHYNLFPHCLVFCFWILPKNLPHNFQFATCMTHAHNNFMHVYYNIFFV